MPPFKRNKLAYPAGYAPGFDPTHVAAANAYASTVCFQNTHVNLLDGLPMAVTGSPVPGILGAIGRGVNITAGSTDIAFASNVASSNGPQMVTLASIVQLTTINGAQQSFQNTGGVGVHLGQSGQLFMYSNGFIFSTIPIVANVPYFIIGSLYINTANFLVRNLQTGQVRTETISAGPYAFPTDTGYHIGNNSGGNYIDGYSAASMYSRTYLTLQQMLKWSEDPWSYWYPQRKYPRGGFVPTTFRASTFINQTVNRANSF